MFKNGTKTDAPTEQPATSHQTEAGEVRSISTAAGPVYVRCEAVDAITPTTRGGSVLHVAGAAVPLEIPTEAAALAIWAPIE